MEWTRPFFSTALKWATMGLTDPSTKRTGPDMNATTYGIDLAKNVSRIHGADPRGKALVRKRLSRKKLLA
jgi:hypothetical protein